MTFRQPQPDLTKVRATAAQRNDHETRAEALQIAAHCQCREFADLLEAHLIGKKTWGADEIEKLADRIRRVAWARDRGEV